MRKDKVWKQKGRKISCLLAAAVLSAGLLSGCGSSKSAGSSTTESATASESAGSSSASSASAGNTASATDPNGIVISADKDETKTDYYKIKILTNKESLCLAPVHIAQINGYFQDEFTAIGQDYDIIPSNFDTITEQITSEEITAGYGLTGSLLQPIANGLDIVFVTGLHTGCTKYYAKPDSGIKSPADLKGKTVGVPSLSDSSVIQLKRKLHDLGFKVNGDKPDITLVAYSMTDLPAALDNGAVDAIGVHDPVATTAEESYGFTKILDTGTDDKFKNEYCCQAYVSRKAAEQNPKGAAAYARALQKACAFIEAEPEKAAELQVQYGFMPGDAKHNGEILKSLSFVPSVSLGRETFKNSFRELQEIGDIDANLDLDDFLAKTYPDIEGVPESFTYDPDTDTFTEVTEPLTSAAASSGDTNCCPE